MNKFLKMLEEGKGGAPTHRLRLQQDNFPPFRKTLEEFQDVPEETTVKTPGLKVFTGGDLTQWFTCSNTGARVVELTQYQEGREIARYGYDRKEKTLLHGGVSFSGPFEAEFQPVIDALEGRPVLVWGPNAVAEITVVSGQDNAYPIARGAKYKARVHAVLLDDTGAPSIDPQPMTTFWGDFHTVQRNAVVWMNGGEV